MVPTMALKVVWRRKCSLASAWRGGRFKVKTGPVNSHKPMQLEVFFCDWRGGMVRTKKWEVVAKRCAETGGAKTAIGRAKAFCADTSWQLARQTEHMQPTRTDSCM